MPLEELFEAAGNDEPIVSDEVAVLGNCVEVALPFGSSGVAACASWKPGACSRTGSEGRSTGLGLKSCVPISEDVSIEFK